MIKNEKNIYLKKTYKQCISDYEPLIHSIAIKFTNSYPTVPLRKEDYENLMLYRLKYLADNYDESYGKSHPMYIKEGLKNYLFNQVRKYLTKKHQVMNNYVELTTWNETKDSVKISEPTLTPSMIAILTPKERDVLQLSGQGYTREEIEVLLGWTTKQVYSTKARAIKKLKEKQIKSV